MTTTQMTVTPAAEALRAWLLNQEFLGLAPVDVELRIEEDLRDEQMLIILVTLPTPDPGDTWSINATRRMSLAVRDKALDLGLAWPWYVRLRPEHEEPVADEDREEQTESRLR